MKPTCVRFLGPDEVLEEPLKRALARHGALLVDDARDADVIVTTGVQGTLSALEDCQGLVVQLWFDKRDLVIHRRVVHHDIIQQTEALLDLLR